MVFKLVRIDTQEPCKIRLSIGTHVIGRGRFLHNDETDKRVSRNHAELVVTTDTVSLKSLHQNPCFFVKKSIETQLLNQDATVCLYHGDKFGLLPDHFWYEVLHCPDQDNAEGKAIISETVKNGVYNNEDDRMDQTEGVSAQDNVSPGISALASNDDKPINFDECEEKMDPILSASPSLLTAEEDAAKEMTSEPETVEGATRQEPVDQDFEENHTVAEAQDCTEQEPPEKPVTIKQESANHDTQPYDRPEQVPRGDNPKSPAKRNHSSTESSPVDVKKLKIEQADAEDAAAGPSNDQQASADNNGKDNIAAPASPVKPAPLLRERCIYGANCYRKSLMTGLTANMTSGGTIKVSDIVEIENTPQGSIKRITELEESVQHDTSSWSDVTPAYRRNPQHKAQFSHPTDSDWGDGPRGVCPFGANCRRREPRHWAAHTHPPGTIAPAAAVPRPGQRRKRKPRNESVSDDDVEDSPVVNLIVTGKRARKTLNRQDWGSGDSDEERDPYGTDESDEWQPPSDATTSQDYSQDL